MSNDLSSLFNERPAASSTSDGETIGTTTAAAPPPSPTAIELDRWGRHKGRDLTESVWNHNDAGAQIHNEHNLADAHAALFLPEPQLSPNCEDKARSEWFKQLMETPEYRSLHHETCLDSTISEIASKSIADQWVQYVQECQKNQPKPGQPGTNPGEGPGEDGEPIDGQIARIRSTANAVQKAADDAQTAKDTAAGLGMGDGKPLDANQLANAFRRIRKNPRLASILNKAGRFRRAARSLQRRKVKHGRDDTVGIELAGDLSRIVTSELAHMASGIPALEMLAMNRLATRTALCREYKAFEKVAKGPIVVCVDESASMDGEPIEKAKAVALTLGWIAREQKRWIAFVGFEAGPGVTSVAFPPSKWDEAKLFDWLTHFYNGGTQLQFLGETIPQIWPKFAAHGMPQGKTDLITITDGAVGWDNPAWMKGFLAFKAAEQVKHYALILDSSAGGFGEPGICDQVFMMGDIDIDEQGIQSVFSI